ncbi:MAG: DNA polymerase III subunit epsilon [Coriobacteriales bacterium]|nr:DNA polymerase III subunit epsilon [Coriobacteriales bacterium]
MPSELSDLLIPGTDADVIARYASLSERAREATFGVMEEEYVVCDTETTGFTPGKDSLIEVAAAIICGPQILQRFSTFVNPGQPIPEFITELTGISDADVQGAPTAAEAVAALADFAGERPIIAHNAAFDQAFISASAPPGTTIGHISRWIDSLELARIALPRLREHKLESLSRAFGVYPSSHRAIDDVEALCGLWRILLVAISDLPSGLPALLAELFAPTDWPLRPVLRQVAGATGATSSDFSLAAARRAREGIQVRQRKYDAEDIAAGISLKSMTTEELEQAYSASGLLAAMYEGFEPRPEQLLMAGEVAAALGSQTHRVIEAGTGVGKSMAYLLPLALFAQRNEVIGGVATKTNALLDQLMYNELPRLDAALAAQPGGRRISYVALKGYDHYPCLRKLSKLSREERRFDSGAAPTTLAMLLSHVCQSARGDLDPLVLNWRELPRWEAVANAEDCLRHKCRYYQHCLLHGARRAAADADIVVTNHALLFCDVLADGGILPPCRQWVVDEAHAVEAEARQQFNLVVEARSLTSALDGLLHTGGALNLLRKAAEGLNGASLLLGRIDAASAEAQALLVIADSFFSSVKELIAVAEKSSYDRVELWISAAVRDSGPWGALASLGGSLAKRLEQLCNNCREIISLCVQFAELEEAQVNLAGLYAELRQQLDALVLIIGGDDQDYVYHADLDRREQTRTDRLIASRIDIGALLAERLYPACMSVIYTSATLAAGESFDYFLRSSGLGALAAELYRTVRFDSSYDFETNMAVYLPTDMPEPNTPGYHDALEELLLAVHRSLGGSTLTLFTNRRDMERLYQSLKPQLEAAGINLRCQFRGFSARRLRDEFLANESLSLFALRSFWEGFDAPGDTLRCVIIPKLPFGRPTDPLLQERQLRERDVWRNYVLPEAVIDLKQAAGRLIRSSTDHGALILADSRLLSKWYGKVFLAALPSQQRHPLTIAEIAQSLSAGV